MTTIGSRTDETSRAEKLSWSPMSPTRTHWRTEKATLAATATPAISPQARRPSCSVTSAMSTSERADQQHDLGGDREECDVAHQPSAPASVPATCTSMARPNSGTS